MSTITQLLCNKFGGIRERNAVFNDEMITACDMQNIELYYTGINSGIGIRTTKGNISIDNSLVGNKRIINIWESNQAQKKYFFVYAIDNTEGVFYNYNRETHTLEVLKSGLTPSKNSNGFDLTQGWSDLFFFTNGSEMFTIEMNKTGGALPYVDIVDMHPRDTQGRTVLGLNACLFDNRLWIFSNNIAWYSVQANIYDFATHDGSITTSAGYIELLKNVTAVHEYLGSLAVFFADSSLLIQVNNGTFSVGDTSPAGCAGYDALVFHDTNLYFYDDTKKSVFSFQQVVTGEKTLGQNIAVDVQNILLKMDSLRLDDIHSKSIFMEGRNEIWWILPTDETYTVDEKRINEETGEEYIVKITKEASIILIYDYLKGEWTKRKSQKINAVNIIDETLYSAGNDGNIFEEYNSDTFNGDFIERYYNCTPVNLGADNTLKVLAFPPRVSFDMPYNNQFWVEYRKNYNTFKKRKRKFIKSKLKNFMYWDIDNWDEKYWSSMNTNAIGKFPNATFKTLEIFIKSEKATETFSIKNIEFSKIKVKQV